MQTPIWLTKALAELGVSEVRGGENPRIIEYHKATSLRAVEDEIPWCSSFVNWVFSRLNMQGTNSAAARSWLKWGDFLDVPKLGAVCVLSRGEPTQGHVGFWVGEVDGHVLLLGGNQGDKVQVDAYEKSRVLSYRWPLWRQDMA